ncbi:Rv1355c family protein [Cytophagaceae bacterium YF14B1]|uniref:Rv1355c family protein n=1 Tax=Xanthocytophaga flava TaxID=3048013 RepID=A0AAE3QQR3_9BACT|nr:Rv1355c family protein [Xanthocytophaga flavus]MDJ1481678.1 Rv1355c family protein [Xanthocytophaga flavus]
MHELLQSRLSENSAQKQVFQPRFFYLSNVEDELQLKKLLAENPHIRVFDELKNQLEELIKSLNPSTLFTKETLHEAVDAHLGTTDIYSYGVWVYYPWSARLVHIVDKEEFIFLRTSRNHYKITPEEQKFLSTRKIGVVGLSVGQSVSVTMAMERLFGEVRLADFDLLELTNLNRIRTGVHNLGLPKVISVAREILEIDPFLNVVCYTDGLTEENMDDFFTKGGKLDLLVEECDGIDIKILCRYKARELGIPIVMEASDRGLLDVERFDLEPNRPILHGLIDHLDPQKAKILKTSEEKLPYMLPIVGFETLSTRLKASALEVGQSITTWPQLASAVTFGGGLTADVSRRIMLNEYNESGRYYVDLEELVRNTTEHKTDNIWVAPVAPLSSEEMIRLADTITLKPTSLQLSKSVILELLTAANLAPSSGNNQPWKWLYRHNRLFLFLEQSRSYSFWDVDNVFAYVGLGAALENLILKTRQKGYDVQLSHFPKKQNSTLVAVISFIASDAISSEPSTPLDGFLTEHITTRVTNRNNGSRTVLSQEKFSELQNVLQNNTESSLHILNQETELTNVASIITACERLRFLHPEGHREFFQHELRWPDATGKLSEDGLDLSTFDLSSSDILGLRLAKSPEVISMLRNWQKGKGLERFSKKLILNSSAVGLVTVSGSDNTSLLHAGQAIQRVWLMANAMGLAVQPVMAPLYLFNYYHHNANLLPEFMRNELKALHPKFNQLFVIKDSQRPVFLFRLAIANPPKVRSLRLPVEKTVVWANSPKEVTVRS